MLATEAQNAAKKPLSESESWSKARDAEASIFGRSLTDRMYKDQLLRAGCNVHINGHNCNANLPFCDDELLTKGTLIETIRNNHSKTQDEFEQMLNARKDSVRKNIVAQQADSTATNSLKCRRCGSHDVTWDVKQTRSSDESCTAFCVCAVCANRWVMK